jgi:hypothetical protein
MPIGNANDRFDDQDDNFDNDPEFEWNEDDAELDRAELPDPDTDLPPEKAASRRAMLGVPNFDDEDDEVSPARATQDILIDEVNELLEDAYDWQAAAERAYDALAIDPAYPRAANALLRCYRSRSALRDMQHALQKLFRPEDEVPHQTHRMLAYSYRVLSQADCWQEWLGEIPPELAPAAEALEAGRLALNHAYFSGDEDQYRQARTLFADARDRCEDRSALMWFLAREYADKGYFADSAALLGALIAAGSIRSDVQRLYAEMIWWRDHSRRLPWIH